MNRPGRRLLPVLALAGALLLAAAGCRRPATEAAPDPAVVEAVNRGVSLMGQYDYDGAVGAFAEALAADPQLPDVKVNLAIARFNRGRKEHRDVEEATRLLDEVIRQEPANPRAWYFKAIVLQHQGQAEPAVACLEKVLQLRPDDGVTWYLLGLCQQRLNRDAAPALRRAIELRPHLASAHYRLWQTLQSAGQSELAAPYLESFKQLRASPLAETIELPQYHQMGDLALVVPLNTPRPAPRADNSYQAGQPVVLASQISPAPAAAATGFGGAAFADLRRDGHLTAFLTGAASPLGSLALGPAARIAATPVALPSDIGSDHALAIAAGDYDNDGRTDLLLVGAGGNTLLHGTAAGTLERVEGFPPAASGRTRSALWLDADHDGDLDLLLCHQGAPDQFYRNNADGTFTETAESAGLAGSPGDSVAALAADLDGDRDMDLVILRETAPARLLLNELSGKFREAAPGPVAIRGELGAVLQDFNGDGFPDLVALGGQPAQLRVFLGDGHGRLAPADPAVAAPPEPLVALRAADVDLDGDLDLAVFGRGGHLLRNDGTGHFTLQARVWTAAPGARLAGAELADLNGDFVPDLLLVEAGSVSRVLLVPGTVRPAPTALALAPTGVRSRDLRTRSPASGYGTTLVLRTGAHAQVRFVTGLAGGPNQSPLPTVLGLGGARRADYVQLAWPDGVAQVERELAAGQTHAVAETQRKISSCPLLFTWNGERFEFITDFAGVGGLGYFVAPGEYAAPQPADYVKIEPEQLRARDGKYELRVTEAMEESAYVDRLELLAIDHPAGWQVFPDERLAVTGPPPTHDLLAVSRPLHPLRATDPTGLDCTAALQRIDRRFAFAPALDRRFFGFCRPHTLELDFGDQLAGTRPGDRVFLFVGGYLEYPYSQTTFAAGQARVGWEPIRVERQRPDGTWETLVPDAGALGGMSRTMTVELPGLAGAAACRLRLTSNLEIYYDRIFLGVPDRTPPVAVHALPVAAAELRYLGFNREVSPDGRYPLVYDYHQVEPQAPFRSLAGAYTRYGPVRELLTDFDDEFALLGPGDEIAVSFDATALPEPAPGTRRSFVLVSHAYCKDMDLYTATPQTLGPLPFRGMSRYPYPATEQYPDSAERRLLRTKYQTRLID